METGLHPIAMRWLVLLTVLAPSCSLYEPCEPSIEYNQEPTLELDVGCGALMFEGDPIPVERYPEGTSAIARDCGDCNYEQFTCSAGAWRFVFPTHPVPGACFEQ
jgi:hypothetical protein